MNSLREGEIPLTPSFEKVLKTVTELVLTQVCFVRRNRANPKLVDGFILLNEQIPVYSLESVLYTVVMYVKPEYRTFALARSLLSAAKKYAIIVNSIPLVFDLFSQKDVSKKKKLLTYLGFKEIGSFYVFKPSKKDDTSWAGQSAD